MCFFWVCFFWQFFYCKYFIIWCLSTFILGSFFTLMGFSVFTFIVCKTFCLFSFCLLIFHIIFSWPFLSSQHQWHPCCLDLSYPSLEIPRRRNRSRSRSRSRSREGAGAGKNKLYEDLLSPPCGVWVETCHQLISEKRGKLFKFRPTTIFTRLLWQSLIN